MGKNRHSKDRLFITATEHKTQYGGKKAKSKHDYQALPFDHCSLSLAPYETPVCTKEGVIFDLVNLVPFIRKHKVNPVSGEPMTSSDIIRLNMAKNADGLWHCPVLFKVFTPHSNPDDPAHMALRDISNFKHLETMRDEASAARSSSSDSSHVRHNPTSDRVMQALKKQQEEKKITDAAAAALAASRASELGDPNADVAHILALSPTCEDVIPGHTITDQRAGSSFTSSSADVHTKNFFRPPTAEEIREARWKHMRKLGKKGYVQLETSFGNINLEIHCDWAPRTAWNFITLCERGYYDDTLFHRLVPGFMLQGGDPTGTGSGGESAWGTPFRDEFDSRLKHDKRGIVSMANSGLNTNGSQFFITMQATPHLDLKHGVFARVVGGMEVLDRIEKVETNVKTETPLSEIKLLKVNVFVNPITESDEIFEQTVKDSIAARQKASIPSATKSITEQKQAIAASKLTINNKDSEIFLDFETTGGVVKKSPNSGPSIGKYLGKQGNGMSSSQSLSANRPEKGTGVAGGPDAAPSTNSTSSQSAEDRVAAFLRSQGGGSEAKYGEEAPSNKKRKMVGSGGFNNW